jgi:predicted secreted acid phosphatase
VAQRHLRQAHTPHAKDVARRELALAKAALRRSKAALARAMRHLAGITVPGAPAVVFDADDTTLWNYDLEDGVLHFVYDPAVAATWISGHLFPAVPGMVPLVQGAENAGCSVFGLTGRPASQQADTIANLTEDGYVDSGDHPLFTGHHYFTKDVANQPWVDCGPDRACSTIEYKSATRAHIEDLGFNVVGNFGDQYSDLIGGFADHVYKIPNPTYYLP